MKRTASIFLGIFLMALLCSGCMVAESKYIKKTEEANQLTQKVSSLDKENKGLKDKIKSLTGILYYGNNRYKVVPRTNADFSGVTNVPIYRTDIVPDQYALLQNYPNPFNPATSISYGLPVSGYVTLKVYNVIGQEVATLVDATQSRGSYTVHFDASKLSSGMYLYRINSGSFKQVKKMMLVK